MTPRGRVSIRDRERKDAVPGDPVPRWLQDNLQEDGANRCSFQASQPSSFWTEELDVDDDGTVEDSQYLYDAKRGILYTCRKDDLASQEYTALCPRNARNGSITLHPSEPVGDLSQRSFFGIG